MPAKQIKHPSGVLLKAFALGQLADADSAAVERHVAGCDECCQVLGSVDDDRLLEIARVAADTSQFGETNLTPAPAGRAVPTVPADLIDHPK
ncbi:MAG: anti-sigma factor RsiW, partial [Pirellulaceae bacterium]